MQMLTQKHQRLADLEMELASSEARRQHMTGAMTCLLRHHDCFKGKAQASFPFADFKKMEEGAGIDDAIDTSRNDITQEFVISVVSAREYMLKLQGLMVVEADYTVPKKHPFVVKVELPEGAIAQGGEVSYKGKDLTFVPPADGKPDHLGKPKNPREYAATHDGTHLFTADSAGLTLHFKITCQLPAPAAEKEAELEPLTCEGDFHKDANAPGMRCEICGDSRKLESVAS